MKEKIFALGFFDGVHRGHQALLAECVRLAAESAAMPAAITFDKHPQATFTSAYPPLLSSLPDRLALLEGFGMQEVLTLSTSGNIMSTPWEDFLTWLLGQGAVGFVCGEDFRFGAKGAGNADSLQIFCRERGLPCSIVPEQQLWGQRISSTRIRGLLAVGDLEGAESLLGHRHILTGTVVAGKQIGRTIGTPTANLSVSEGIALPKKGVYACWAQVGSEKYKAVTNIGTRPTVDGDTLTVEPWLLDFSGDLYGKEITLEFMKFLRPERKFASLEELKAEILHNAQQARDIL